MNFAIIFAMLSAFFAALVAILSKIGLTHLDNTLATTARSMVMTVFLIATSFYLGKFSLLKSINNKALLFIIFSGFSGALSWLFYFAAIQIGKTTTVVAIDRTSIVFALILAIIFLGEKPHLYSFIGALLMTLGAFLMSI